MFCSIPLFGAYFFFCGRFVISNNTCSSDGNYACVKHYYGTKNNRFRNGFWHFENLLLAIKHNHYKTLSLFFAPSERWCQIHVFLCSMKQSDEFNEEETWKNVSMIKSDFNYYAVFLINWTGVLCNRLFYWIELGFGNIMIVMRVGTSIGINLFALIFSFNWHRMRSIGGFDVFIFYKFYHFWCPSFWFQFCQVNENWSRLFDSLFHFIWNFVCQFVNNSYSKETHFRIHTTP